ncbi:mitosis initiation protein fs(1)Ya [Bactrocera dorsalis]|uniref:Mitosis initiation protein fs(1)Ya n=1 Tax=Bactrocera dorsalis TaxID=27457 RepID=A0A6I9V2F8_BACDO|nr:mitosis initiation protein fs(1)Ya [Bactrocera dorsalis]
MKIPKDVICGVCKKIFCCAECRYKHEIKTHAIVVQKPKISNQSNEDVPSAKLEDQSKKAETNHIYLFCPLCERKPMPLQREMYAEMLAHVEQNHLPLRCRKCAKVYNRLDDLQNFSKCTQIAAPTCCYPDKGCCNQLDHTCDTVTLQKEFARVTISTQTSPQRRQSDEFHETPMSLINLRWKAKSKLTHEEFVCDSVSSLRNISSISNSSLRRSLDAIIKPKGQIVRTTSTPVHAELLCTKHTERTFNASGAQVSSIYHSGGETDNHSPAIAAGAVVTSNPVAQSPTKQQLENINRYLKVPRGKMSAVTPLRQVMSKSIQKAFAEHGGLPSARISGADLPPMRKNMFDSHATDISSSSVGSPLDLRMSPVVRRTHTEIQMSQLQDNCASAERKSSLSQNMRHEVFRSSQKLTTTESIVITRTKHLAGLESAASSMSSTGGSVAFKTADKLTTSASSTRDNCSGVSSSGGNSVYKSCESIEIITATTALSEIQQGYYAVNDKLDNAKEPIIPTMENVAQVVSYNLPPITPITRIPGALINKKFIRFDSPCEEEDELEIPDEIKKPKDKPNSVTPTKQTMPSQSANVYGSPQRANNSTANAGSKAHMKVPETPRSCDSSTTEAFFTPTATPVRRSKMPLIQEKPHNSNDFRKPASGRAPALSKHGRSAAFDRSESITDNDNENDAKEHSVTTKHQTSQNTSAALGRSWSFSALLGSVMRLNSTGKEATPEKIETPSRTDVNSNSIIKRCASIAGSLMRTQSLIDEDEQGRNQKRKRSYTTDVKSISSVDYQRQFRDPVSPSPEKALRTKRFRIHGRKPIERMRREL